VARANGRLWFGVDDLELAQPCKEEKIYHNGPGGAGTEPEGDGTPRVEKKNKQILEPRFYHFPAGPRPVDISYKEAQPLFTNVIQSHPAAVL